MACTATIRAGMEALLSAGLPSVSSGALDSVLDFVAEKIVTESTEAQAMPAVGPALGHPSP